MWGADIARNQHFPQQDNDNDASRNISGILTRISASLRDCGWVGSLQVCEETDQ